MEGGGMLSSSSSHSQNYIYRECLRNHAASLGSYATDGCGEFTIDDSSPSAVNSLQCAACGCHRNFHRKITAITRESAAAAAMSDQMMEYSGGGGSGSDGRRKRYRTKFTPDQKEKMMGFAEKLGWKLQRKELDEEIERFCESVGVSRQVFKVWMHNHKNSCFSNSSDPSTGNANSSLTQ
ncbi:putative transcription factor ZF-HD family [Medicago truncatula]|uniref:Putative transcription factor ZF-HD family n=1 Tax=Medicago truncatula TaxID=3880 RepID=A0A072UBE0_MEDTR|nr:zinc-finger homeodomain protein 5 [Medicago truncatula]KEH26786.1 zinc finger homeodomain protein [Medicago truncatula]RHN52382.1 putative transcription factor ZF-HD family [Medicago truncatula]